MFDLTTDRKKVFLATLGGAAILMIHVVVSCHRRFKSFCQGKCSRYELAATGPDRVTLMEWELQELNYV